MSLRSYLHFRISPRKECNPPGDSRGSWLCSTLEDKVSNYSLIIVAMTQH